MSDYEYYPSTEITSHWSSHLLKPPLDLDEVAWNFHTLCVMVEEADEGREVVYLNDLTILIWGKKACKLHLYFMKIHLTGVCTQYSCSVCSL